MHSDKYVYGLAKSLLKKDSEPVPIHDRDEFSEFEACIHYGDFPLALHWSRGLWTTPSNEIVTAEYIQILSNVYIEDMNELEDEEYISEIEVVFEAVRVPGSDSIETYFYAPGVWTEKLEQKAKIGGIIN